MIKARYELVLFLKASRLRYPARMRSNPVPTPPAKEAVLPFFKYPKTPPPIRISPYGIVKQKSCIFSNWVFSGKLFGFPENLSSTKVSDFQCLTDQKRTGACVLVVLDTRLFIGVWNSVSQRVTFFVLE
jgi:hypothetical protein